MLLFNEMDVKEDGEVREEWPPSGYGVLQQISEEAVRVAGEALESVYSGSPSISSLSFGHRRSRSEVVTSIHGNSNKIQRWKSQMQRALRWGSHSGEQAFFNPEVLANQKRQWYQFHSKASGQRNLKEPSSLFEHFIIAGVHPDANLEVVEDAFAKRKKLEFQLENSEMIDFSKMQYRVPSFQTLEPQILFKYPPGIRLDMRLRDLAAFCFPGGVKARLLERTPSLTDLNELVYGQEHLSRDDLSFVFSLKVADDSTLYGVCLHVQEFVQRPPAIFGATSMLSQTSRGRSRFLVSAPRCYCLLTRVPFFELHYEMLNSIIAQERLNRITQFVGKMTLADDGHALSKLNGQMNQSFDPVKNSEDWMASAIPVESAVSLAAAAAGIASGDMLRSSESRRDPCSPVSTASEGSSHSQSREKDGRKESECFDDFNYDVSEQHNCLERIHGGCGVGYMPAVEAYVSPEGPSFERLGSSESLFSSVRSTVSEDEEDEIFRGYDKDTEDLITEWARSKNDLLKIVSSYHALPLPSPGNKIVFKPLEHLQPVEYQRSPINSLGVSEKHLIQKMQDLQINDEVAVSHGDAEDAVALSIWTIATICRVLSLENVLTLVSGVLLEKQVVIVCPNLGVLSAIVLSLIPMILPFEWQSLFLPVLPGKMFDFLDAPVPFVVGIQHKRTDLKMKTRNLVQVNVAKDQVKMCSLPTIPRYRELIAELGPVHARLASVGSVAKRHPVYKCSEVQAEAAAQFLAVMRRYLESLCSDLSSHTITSVQSNNDRISVLLKDSFVDSFPSKDQPFIKLFVDTQLFTVLSDSRLSIYESGRY